MHDLAKSRENRNVSLNINPCISMKPIISILLKSVEVVVNEKSKFFFFFFFFFLIKIFFFFFFFFKFF